MDDQNASCIHDGEEYAQLSLLHLPMEIFLHICSFLDAQSLIHGLSLACKQFYQIFMDDDFFWKARINRIWPNATHSLLRPVKPNKLFWMSSCVAMEKQIVLWKQQDSMVKLTYNPCPNGIFGSINHVLLMHDATACVSATGGTLIYWKLPSREKSSYEIGDTVYINSAHDGEICDLTATDNTIYTCSCLFDESVKSWMLTNTGLVHDRTYEIKIQSFYMRVSSCPERSLFATGSRYGIDVFDSRSSNKPISPYRPHTEHLTKLAMNTEYIMSASEDRTVAVWDQRAGRIMKSIYIPGGSRRKKVFPTCMDMRRDYWVCVGDNKGRLHMLDPKNNFKLVKSYSTEHTDWITGVRLTHGCLITSSWNGTVRISSLTDPPKPIVNLRSEFELIYDMDYMNDTLVVSGPGIEVWRPKN